MLNEYRKIAEDIKKQLDETSPLSVEWNDLYEMYESCMKSIEWCEQHEQH